MTGEEINGLVLSIQKKVVSKLKITIEEARKKPAKELIKEVNKDSEFEKLITTAEKEAKKRISFFFLPAWLEEEDIWQSFLEKKFLGCVIKFDQSKSKFMTLLNFSISNFCIDETKRKPEDETDIDEIDEKDILNPPPLPEKIVLLMDDLKILIDSLDRLGNTVNNKLVYHCKVILPTIEKLKGKQEYVYLKLWQGESLETVSNLIEDTYSKICNTKTVFMKNTEEQLIRGEGGRAGDRAGDIFLDNVNLNTKSGNDYINGRVSVINRSLERNRADIIDNIND